MKLRDLVPWRAEETRVPVRREEHPLARLQKEMNTLLEDFFSSVRSPFSFFSEGSGAFNPRVNVEETTKDIRVTVETPGMEQSDVDVSLTEDALVIQGEKRQEEQREDGATCYRESSYGSFRRVIPLGAEVERDKVEASMKNGVLRILLPKSEEAVKSVKKISIRSE